MIDTTTRHKRGNHRNYFHMNTKYDNRNCSAWHVKNVQKFSLAAIIATGDEMSEVETLDELNLVDKNGTALTQQYLVDHLGYLNGETMIGGFTSTTTLHRVNQGQKAVTKNQEKLESYGVPLTTAEDEVRERRKLLDTIDKQLLQVTISSFLN